LPRVKKKKRKKKAGVRTTAAISMWGKVEAGKTRRKILSGRKKQNRTSRQKGERGTAIKKIRGLKKWKGRGRGLL